MDISFLIIEFFIDITFLKFNTRLIGIRNNKSTETKRQQCNYSRRYHIRKQKTLKADTGTEYSYDLTIISHFRGKKDYGNKSK